MFSKDFKKVGNILESIGSQSSREDYKSVWMHLKQRTKCSRLPRFEE